MSILKSLFNKLFPPPPPKKRAPLPPISAIMCAGYGCKNDPCPCDEGRLLAEHRRLSLN